MLEAIENFIQNEIRLGRSEFMFGGKRQIFIYQGEKIIGWMEKPSEGGLVMDNKSQYERLLIDKLENLRIELKYACTDWERQDLEERIEKTQKLLDNVDEMVYPE